MGDSVLQKLGFSVFDFDVVNGLGVKDVVRESMVGSIEYLLMLRQEFIDVFHNFFFYLL